MASCRNLSGSNRPRACSDARETRSTRRKSHVTPSHAQVGAIERNGWARSPEYASRSASRRQRFTFREWVAPAPCGSSTRHSASPSKCCAIPLACLMAAPISGSRDVSAPARPASTHGQNHSQSRWAATSRKRIAWCCRGLDLQDPSVATAIGRLQGMRTRRLPATGISHDPAQPPLIVESRIVEVNRHDSGYSTSNIRGILNKVTILRYQIYLLLKIKL